MVVMLGVVFLIVDKKTYQNYIKQEVVAVARARGIQLNWVNGDFTYSRVAFSQLEIQPPHGLKTKFDTLVLTPRNLRLREGVVTMDFEGTLYGGWIKGSGDINKNGEFIPRRVTADGIVLSKIEQFEFFSLEGGVVALNFPEFTGDTTYTLEGRGTVSVTKLSKRIPTKVPGFVLGLPFPINVPAFENITLQISHDLNDTDLHSVLNLDSTFGKCSSDTLVPRSTRPGTRILGPGFKGETSCSLTSQGQQIVGPFLPLMSQGKISAQSSKFELLFNTVRKPVRIEWKDTGAPDAKSSETTAPEAQP